jgi:hypothetical protein
MRGRCLGGGDHSFQSKFLRAQLLENDKLQRALACRSYCSLKDCAIRRNFS